MPSASYADLQTAVQRLDSLILSNAFRSLSAAEALASRAAEAAAECKQLRTTLQAAMGGDKSVLVREADVADIKDLVDQHTKELERIVRRAGGGEGDGAVVVDNSAANRVLIGLRDGLLRSRAAVRSNGPAAAHMNDDEAADDGQTLREIAEATGVPIDALRQANPFLAHLTLDNLVPAGTAVVLPQLRPLAAAAAEEEEDRPLVSPARRRASPPRADHKDLQSQREVPPAPQQVETIASISHRTGVPLSKILALNPHLASRFDPLTDPLPVGTAVNIPRHHIHASPTKGKKLRSSSREARSQTNEAEESFLDVAANTGVPVEDLRLANPQIAAIFPEDVPLPPNTVLKIPEPLMIDPRPGRSTPRHAAGTSSSRETLQTVAAMHMTSTSSFRDLNPHMAQIASDEDLPPGTSLIVPRREQSPARRANVSSPPRVEVVAAPAVTAGGVAGVASSPSRMRPGGAQSGETLRQIAALYDMDVEFLVAANPHLRSRGLDVPLPTGVAVEVPKDAIASRRRSAPQQTPPRETSAAPVSTQQDGDDPATLDTIRKLACKFNIDTDLFRRKNPHIGLLGDDERIPPGTALRVPSPARSRKGLSSPSPTRAAPLAVSELATLRTVAEHEGISISVIKRMNPSIAALRDDEPLPINMTLKVPKRQDYSQHHSSSNNNEEGEKDHIDTIRSVCAKFAVKESALREWNPALASVQSDAQLPEKMQLKIPTKGTSNPVAESSPPRHQQQPQATHHESEEAGAIANYSTSSAAGDESGGGGGATIRSIARQCGVSEAQLRAANPSILNGLASDAVIAEGTPLRIPKGAKSSSPPPRQRQASSSPPAKRTSSGVGSSSKTLADVAALYNISIDVIRALNPHVAQVASDAELPQGTDLKLPRTAPVQDEQRADEDREDEEGRGGGENGPQRNTLADIAAHYGVSVRSILLHNPHVEHFEDDEELPDDTRLNIPLASSASPSQSTSLHHDDDNHIFLGDAQQKKKQGHHQQSSLGGEPPSIPPANAPAPSSALKRQQPTSPPPAGPATRPYAVTERRESVRSIASQHDITVKALRDANTGTLQTVSSSDAFLPIGTVLAIPDPARLPTPASADPAAGIDNSLGEKILDQSEAPRSNKMNDLQSGRIVLSDDSQQAIGIRRVAPTPSPLRDDGSTIKQTLFPAQPGERIGDLARRLNVSEAELRRCNHHLRNVHFSVPLAPDTIVEIPTSSSSQPAAVKSKILPSSSLAQHQKMKKTTGDDEQGDQGSDSRTVIANGELSVSDICNLYFVTEDSLRSVNPFLRRYHAQTLIPEGTVLVLEPSKLLRQGDDEGSSGKKREEFEVTAPKTTLSTICDLCGVTERRLRRLNPHLALVQFSTDLPIGTVVTTDVPLQLYHRQGIDRYLVVRTIAHKSHALLSQRYFAKWRLFSTVFSPSRVSDEQTRELERQRLEYQVQVGRLTEADLKRRVTELRMTVDSMRPTTVASQMAVAQLVSNTVAGHQEAAAQAAIEREAITAAIGAAAAAQQGAAASRSMSAIVADTSGLPWMGQPVFIPSTSPKRAVSPATSSSLRRTASPSNNHATFALDNTVDSARGSQQPLLGLTLSGLVVAKVTGPASLASGIKEGDVILRVDGKLINSQLAFRQAVQRAPGPRVLLSIRSAAGGQVSSHHVPLASRATSLASSQQHLVASPPSLNRTVSPSAAASRSQSTVSYLGHRNPSPVGRATVRGGGVPLHLSPRRRTDSPVRTAR